MSSSVNVDLGTLEKATTMLFEHLRKQGIERVEIDKDYYWNVPLDKKFDHYERPEDLDVGQLSEDWQWIRKIASGESDPIGYGFVWLSSLYRAIGEEHVP